MRLLAERLNMTVDYEFEKIIEKSLMLEPCLNKKLVVERLLANLDIAEDPALMADIEGIITAPWEAQPYPYTLETLRKLRENGYKLGMISNAFSLSFEPVVTQYHLADFFDVIVASYEVGLLKPDPRIFELALNRLEASSKETLMVGDSLFDDIQAAEALGLMVLMLDNKNKCPNFSPRIISIRDIFSYLDSFSRGE